jgi:hypothetical protein
VIASSSTALANLAYLIGAVVIAVIAGLVIWLRHRQPRSVDANMASFRKGLSALAPDPQSSAGATIKRSDQARIRSAPAGLTHVRIEPSQPADTAEEVPRQGAGGPTG